MPQSEPTVRSRVIGKELRRLRERAGLTLEEAGAFLDRSGSSVSRYENGHHAIRPIELRHMLDVYRVTDLAVRDALLSLARQGRQKGWWRSYRDRLSPSALDFVSLEADAGQIRTFQLSVIPGLLQTPDYATAVIQAGLPPVDRHDIDRVVGFRIARQRILARQDPPCFRVVLGEAALRQRIGSPEVMKAQLLSLVDKSVRGRVEIQVLPFVRGGHPGIDGSFTILDIGDHGMLSVVFVEALSRSWYIEESEELARYHEVFHHLSVMALCRADSLRFIERLVSEA